MMNEIILKGIPAAPGVAFGPAFLFGKEEFGVAPKKITEDKVAEEIARFEEALIKTRHEILEIQKKISEEIPVASAYSRATFAIMEAWCSSSFTLKMLTVQPPKPAPVILAPRTSSCLVSISTMISSSLQETS